MLYGWSVNTGDEALQWTERLWRGLLFRYPLGLRL
jgi:hypothetical protein